MVSGITLREFDELACGMRKFSTKSLGEGFAIARFAQRSIASPAC